MFNVLHIPECTNCIKRLDMYRPLKPLDMYRPLKPHEQKLLKLPRENVCFEHNLLLCLLSLKVVDQSYGVTHVCIGGEG
jgi:hypothetical protein